MHPKNQNEEFQVQQTLGYSYGGDINISNGLSEWIEWIKIIFRNNKL